MIMIQRARAFFVVFIVRLLGRVVPSDGESITVDDVAEWAGTISYEILTGLGERLPRRYSRGEA